MKKKYKLKGGTLTDIPDIIADDNSFTEYEPDNEINDKEKLKEKIKQYQEKFDEWTRDDDVDDYVDIFQHDSSVNPKVTSTQDLSLAFDNTRVESKINYNIINNLQILKENLDELLTIQDYKSLKEFFKKHKMHYLEALVEYLLEEFNETMSTNKKMFFFRKIIKLSIDAMKKLHENIETIKKEKNIVSDPLYRVWRREDQEKSMHKKDEKGYYEIVTDNFLSTTMVLDKAIQFFKNQSSGATTNCIIWEIIFTKEKQHAYSFIEGGDLAEVIFDVGSKLKLIKEKIKFDKLITYTLKTFEYQGSEDDIEGIFDKYDKIIPTMDLVVAIIELEDAINSTGLDIPLLDKKIKDIIKKRERYTRHGLELSDDVLQNVEELISEAKKKRLKIKQGGGKEKICKKKEIMGKLRCIYKKPNDRKEYVKYKGELLTIKEFRKIINTKKTRKTPKASKKT